MPPLAACNPTELLLCYGATLQIPCPPAPLLLQTKPVQQKGSSSGVAEPQTALRPPQHVVGSPATAPVTREQMRFVSLGQHCRFDVHAASAANGLHEGQVR